MRERLIQFACCGALLLIAGAWASVGITGRESAEADNVLRSDFNASGVIESAPVTIEEYRGDRPPVLNQGKPSLPCPECKDWSGQWEGDRFVVRHKGRDVTREVVGSEAEMFSRTPLERNQ